jgi:preprotein translocase subunit SecD
MNFDVIPDWLYITVAVVLIMTTAVLAIQTSGGIRKPVQLLVLTLVTVSYVFSLTFIYDVQPQLGLDLEGGVSVVLEAKGDVAEEDLDVAVDIIRNRVDALGVAEPEISRQGRNIVVDLPGARDAQKAQELIGQTAELRFREVAENINSPEAQQVLQQVAAGTQSELTTTETSAPTASSTTTPISPAPGNSRKFQEDATTTAATTVPVASTQAVSSITLQCGGTNPTSVVLEGDLTKPTPREEDDPEKPIIALDRDGVPYLLCPAILKGDIVANAQRSVDPTTGDIRVLVELTDSGASEFTDKIGRPLANQSVAIVLDSEVVSAPQIQPDLANGLTNNELVITLGESDNQREIADDLATVLRYGSLKVVLEQQTAQKISPSLGTDQLRAGIIAGLIGLAFVVIYMLLYYRILAMVVITGIILAGMAMYSFICFAGEAWGLALTLSGAVGIIVSLGVTVDSYIVYFEKLKDEVRQGRSLRSSLDSGFQHAFKTIFAADIVSLMGATTLYFLASGGVKGFALFLGISTALDLMISLCFMHPMVKVMARNKWMVTSKHFGIGKALDSKDLTV